MVGNMGRMCMAAGLALMQQGQTDPGLRCNVTFRSMDLGSAKSASVDDGLPPAGSGDDAGEVSGSRNAEVRRMQADESLRKAIYMSCWGPN
ncbi:hypothetical protein EJ110_NYTH29744 [Nymphaea thermarum]|nr:hypothetical protein EJ110_NYTH29744 [Nymphaea thermarum]